MKPAPLLLVTCLVLPLPGQAGDEDMNPSMYQIFDPETGYMIPVEKPPGHTTGQQNHSTVQTQPPQTTPLIQREQNPDPAITQPLPMLAGTVIVLAMIWGVIAGLRKGRQRPR